MNKIFIPPCPLTTPVLFLVFNRPDTTKQVFEAIRQAKPSRLFVAADGPRIDKAGEREKCQQVREIATAVDWDCEIKTLFREHNLGCKVAVSSGIDWFFENVEEGIILEDDCLPSQSFFWFCQELLERYRYDMRVWQVAGSNFHFGWKRDGDYSYYFSYYGSIWGWASWKSRWNQYDVEMKNYDEIRFKNYLWDIFGNNKEAKFRINNFEKLKKGIDTWDFQWIYTKLINSGLSIVPIENLIKNLGFGEDATHTNSLSKWVDLNNHEIEIPLKHPVFLIRDKVSDDKFALNFTKNSLIVKIKKLITSYVS